MFKALGKTDLAAIAASRGLASALELISNPRRVTSEIARLEDEIRTADPTRFDTVKAKAEQLAHYLNTGEHGRYILRNAEAIARLLGQPFQNLQRAPAADYVAAIDQLVTLYALQGCGSIHPGPDQRADGEPEGQGRRRVRDGLSDRAAQR